MLTYTFLNKPTSEQIDAITFMYRSQGWWTQSDDDPELVAKIVSGSHCFLLVQQRADIVGMGRAISDGVSDAYIQDVTVKAEYRKRGIGSQIVQRLVERLNAEGLNWVGLIAENNAYEFYEPLGFQVMPNSVPMLNLKK